MNIRWWSPIDPDKTEIGRYSQFLLPSLHSHFALDVVTDATTFHNDYEPAHPVKGMLPVDLYNLGNSELHVGIAKQAMEQPGIVILHDVSLLELSLAFARWHRTLVPSKMASLEYGVDAGIALSALYGGEQYDWCGESQAQYDRFVTTYPLFRTFIGRAQGVIVHSDYAFRRVRRQYDGPVVRLNLPYPAPAMDVSVDIPEPPYNIVFCGHSAPNRRLAQFIEAWGSIGNPRAFRLNLYGNIDKADDIIALADGFGLDGLVNVVGFVEEHELDRAIHDAHLAVNLRNPTMGEASASQLRYWASAVPTIVSDTGWYGELPDDVVVKISPEREHEDLVAALEAFSSGAGSRFTCGPNGLAYLRQQHSIELYIEQLHRFVTSIVERRFRDAIFDERLIPLMGSMCDDVNESGMFTETLADLSSMVEGLEKVRIN